MWGSSSATVECHPNTLALKGAHLENQDIVIKFLMYVRCLTKVLRGSERLFQLQRKVLRMSNFIQIILEVVPSTKLTFLNVAAKFATQAQPQPTREGARSSGLPAHSFPASDCSGARACAPLLACEMSIYTQQWQPQGLFPPSEHLEEFFRTLPNKCKLPKLLLSHPKLCRM